MNYLLSPQTFDCLYSIVKKGDSVFYKTEPPRQIIDFLVENKIPFFQTNDLPDINRTVFSKKINSEWPIVDLSLYAKKDYYIESRNNIPYLNDVVGDFTVYYTDKKLLPFLEPYESVYVDSFDDCPDTTYLIKEYYDENNIFNNNNNLFLQYLGSEKDKTKNYRRFKLNNYLKEKGVVDTIYTGEFSSTKEYKILLISDPRGATSIVDKFAGKALIVYDHTDNWGCNLDTDYEEQQYCLKKADIVFTSAQTLYNYAKRYCEDTYFIPNGCDVKKYIHHPKVYDKKAVYIGKSHTKIDFSVVENMLANGWRVDFYGVPEAPKEINEYENFHLNDFVEENKLHSILQNYAVGLVPFKDGLWTEGMLPLKFFHYTNAHIPTAYFNCDELKTYEKVAFNLANYNIDEIVNTEIEDEEYEKVLKESNWKEKFDKMLDIILAKL